MTRQERITQRGPDGKFLGYGQAIATWLPVLLDAAGEHSALPEALDAMAAWCNRMAGMEYALAATCLSKFPNDEQEPYVNRRAADAERWLRIRARLLATKEIIGNA